MEDRRTLRRFSPQHDFFIDFDSPGGAVRGRLMDISSGGMFISTDRILSPDAFLSASIDFADYGHVIWIDGWVVRADRQGMAIEFADMDRQGVRDLIEYLMRTPESML